jgi:hypothetical protein
MTASHVPVMLDRVVALLAPALDRGDAVHDPVVQVVRNGRFALFA